MEKYGTYRIFKNTETGEIKRIPSSDEEGMEKASSAEWLEIFEDPEDA